jgi:hypothetical protein
MIAGDALEVLNGPEDGAVLPLRGGVAEAGSGGDCLVQLRLDPNIRPRHARLIGTRDGYVVRALERGTVRVDGARVGHLRSRKLRAGHILRLGNSELYLHLCPECEEDRSRGSAFLRSDLSYGMLLLATLAGNTARRSLRFSGGLLRRLLRPRNLVLFALLLGGYLLYAAGGSLFRQAVLVVQWVLHYARMLVSSMG